MPPQANWGSEVEFSQLEEFYMNRSCFSWRMNFRFACQKLNCLLLTTAHNYSMSEAPLIVTRTLRLRVKISTRRCSAHRPLKSISFGTSLTSSPKNIRAVPVNSSQLMTLTHTPLVLAKQV